MKRVLIMLCLLGLPLLWYLWQGDNIDWSRIMKEAPELEYSVEAKPAASWLAPDQLGLLARYCFAKDLDYSGQSPEWEPICMRSMGGELGWREHFLEVLQRVKELPDTDIPVVEDPDEFVGFLLYHPDRPIYYLPRTESDTLSQQRMLAKGYPSAMMDRMAAEFCHLRENVYLVVVSTKGYLWRSMIERILHLYGRVIYRKELALPGSETSDLLLTAYKEIPENPRQWVRKVRELRRDLRRYPADDELTMVYFLECASPDTAAKCKYAVQRHMKEGTSLVHVTASPAESARLADLLVDLES